MTEALILRQAVATYAVAYVNIKFNIIYIMRTKSKVTQNPALFGHPCSGHLSPLNACLAAPSR